MMTGSMVKLRPYQVEAIEQINSHWEDWQRAAGPPYGMRQNGRVQHGGKSKTGTDADTGASGRTD